LENRLDKALQRYNEALAGNKELRQRIDDLRQERVVFDGIYRRMEKELHETKKKMAEAIEASNTSYEIRVNAEFQAAEVRSAMTRDRREFQSMVEELDEKIEEEEERARLLEEATKGELTQEEERQLKADLKAGERQVCVLPPSFLATL
jgi:coiled-coil domain-containing protein 63/114